MSILFSTKRIDAHKAQYDDLDCILEIQSHPENCDYTWHNTKEEYQALMGVDGIYILAFRKQGEEEIIGYSILAHNKNMDSLELRRIVLLDKSQGYGQEIIQGIQKFAFIQLKLHRLWLEVYTFNFKAIYIYEKHNFKRDGTQRDVYKDHRGYLSEHIYSVLADEYFQKQ